MKKQEVVGREEWSKARLALLAKEKEFSRQRDEMSEARRNLPRVKVEQNYVFQGPNGDETLSDLFQEQSQLIVYHFMFGPDWDEGCKSCSFMADHFEPAIVHLKQRGVSMVVASNAPLDKLEGFRQRMGWSFRWVSAMGSTFNQDYQVSFSQDAVDSGSVRYNYRDQSFPMTEAPGISVFVKGDDGMIYHTYSTYARGLDPMLTTYQYLDLVPNGRDEGELLFPMAWIRLHDSYD